MQFVADPTGFRIILNEAPTPLVTMGYLRTEYDNRWQYVGNASVLYEEELREIADKLKELNEAL